MSSYPNPIWRPYTQERSAPPALHLDHAQEAYLYARNGQKIFDGISSWWLITHSHCQPEIVEAVKRQSSRLDQATFANFTHSAAEELADLLIQITPPNLSRIFFTDNGSTAVESALKMALQACRQQGKEKKRRFLAFSKAYHGDTVGAMSVSAESAFTRPYSNLLFDVIRVHQPARFTAANAFLIHEFESLLDAHHESLAGVIIEPLVQGAGGMIVWPDQIVRDIAALCRRYSVYLIFDEVMTGFGRTGSMFAMDRLGVTPDLVCLSKGLTGGTLPLAVTLATEEVYESFLSTDKEKMLFHGHSFTGNPISCAAAVANIKVFQQRQTLNSLSSIECTHVEALGKLARALPIKDHRVCGTIGALELDIAETGYGSKLTESIASAALKEGLFIRPLGNVIYLMPPFSVTRNDINDAWDLIGLIVERELR